MLNAAPYARWVETLVEVLVGSLEDELRKVFHDNAVDFYRLD